MTCLMHPWCFLAYSSVQSRSVLSNSLWPHGLTVHQASLSITTSRGLLKLMSVESMMPSNHLILCHPFSSHLQSFPASGSFLMSQFFPSGGQSIGASASALVLLMNIQDWFPLGWTGWISLQSKGLSRVFSNTTVQKHQFFGSQLSLWSNSHPYMTTGKTIALTRWTFVSKIMSLLFNMLSTLVIAFLPRSKRLLNSWVQSTSAVILEHKEIKALTALFPHLFAMKLCDQMPWSFVFWKLSFKSAFFFH